MRRRTRSPKGARGAATAGTRGGRGRGRARGGAKGKTGRGGGGGKSSSGSASEAVSITKDNHHHHPNNITSSHFNRTPNGSVSFVRGGDPHHRHVLQLGGIPRRPVVGPAHQNGNAVHNNNNNNHNNNNNLNNGGNDFYLHKKFKKVTATVDVAPSPPPSTSSSSSANPSGVGSSSGSVAESSSTSVAASTSSTSSGNSSNSSGMVYKPKFRITSEIEAVTAVEASQQPPNHVSSLSPREKTSPIPATPAPEALVVKSVTNLSNSVASGSSSFLVSKHQYGSSEGYSHVVNTAAQISSHPGPARIGREARIDRKSLDDRISKIIDENQSILEWPEQFTKMLKSHTARGQNPHQRTSHLLSGGSTTELPASSPSSNLLSHHHNGLIRHASTSSDMSTSGGSVELIRTASPQHHQHHLLNNGTNGRSTGGEMLAYKQLSSTGEIRHFPISPSSNIPTDLSFGAHSERARAAITPPLVETVAGHTASSNSTVTASSTTSSSMVPKKRRRLSPTPSRLCGGEVSELPVNQLAGGKNYFQDVDMTVRVSNCSGAKVTIRTNNGTNSGGSVQTSMVAPVDFTNMIDPVPSPIQLKPPNGAIFFPGPGPSSSSTILTGSSKPLSLVSTKSIEPSSSSLSPGILSGTEKPQKSPRGRPRKKSVPEIDSASLSSTGGTSLLRYVPPPPEIPSRPKSSEPVITPKLPPPPPVANIPSVAAIAQASANVSSSPQPLLPHKAHIQEVISVSVASSSSLPAAVEPTPSTSSMASTQSASPTLKSENANPEKDTPFRVVPTPTQNPKRPTFLALKPVNTNSKKTEPGVLPSPETPRVAKPYNQMTINGQAYTYLGFKVSTRSSYTCLFKTQPMFIPQETDPKLSMYTNWQPRPRDPNRLELGISTNDSRVNGRKSPHNILYTTANGRSCDTLTVSSPGNQQPITSPVCESTTFLSGLQSRVASSSFVVGETSETSRCSLPQSSSSPPSLPSQAPQQFSQPMKIQVSPPSLPGIEPISPASSTPSPVTFVSANNPAVGSGGLVSIASSSPKLSAISLTYKERSRQTSSSEQSSMDELSNLSSRPAEVRKRSLKGSQDEDGESNDDAPLALTSMKGDGASLGKDDSDHGSMHSGTMSGGRYDSQRVKIMEGGFESNEDYTYVRGRGRGRYVCEACGIRCKKPSMLRKHLKTHTDLRPYTCKLCNFSFKTKGNLTKHQKSKSHHKKCAGLGIHPESSTSLAMTGPAFSISDTNTTDDNESDDDFDDNGDVETDSQDECDGDSIDGNDNGSESFEKEIAQSLLDLSKATIRLPSAESAQSSDYESGGDRIKLKRPGFPYSSVIEESNSSVGSFTTGEPISSVPETPIDLSVKPTKQPAPAGGYESDAKRIKLEKNGLIRAVGVVKEAEAWEPAEEEGSGCLNLKKVLNADNDNANSEIPEIRIPEVKTEVCDYVSERPKFGPRQRTESETSSCSGTNSLPPFGMSATEVPIGTANKQLPSSTPPPPQAAGSSSSVKLHQPWLSPSEPKDKKEQVEEVAPVEILAANASPDIPKYKPVEDKELTQRDPPASGPPPGIEPSLGKESSPNSKLFSGLSALKPQAEFRQPSGPQALVKDDGKSECNVCGKTFARPSQLTLHMNIHYIERPFRCDPCGVSFRTKGHLIKHRRSSSHDCKVYLTEAWGVANEENPRPFKCPDCKIAFRIHGHLAKHLRSKMHIMRMECLGKLPFGIYFEMEKSGINLNEIDTTDCDMSLVSLQNVARKIYGDQWRERLSAPVEEPPA